LLLEQGLDLPQTGLQGGVTRLALEHLGQELVEAAKVSAPKELEELLFRSAGAGHLGDVR